MNCFMAFFMYDFAQSRVSRQTLLNPVLFFFIGEMIHVKGN